MSTSSASPKWSAVPLPPRPMTPSACASSTIVRAPYFLASATISGSLAMSPPMREHAVGHDQLAAVLGQSLEDALQLVHIVVPVEQAAAVAELAAVVDAGVVLLVADDVVAVADKRGDDAQIGLEAGREGHHRLLVEKVGQLRFQLEVHPQRAVEEPRAGAARAVLPQRLDARVDDVLVDGQAEIVVRAEHDAPLALHNDLDVLPRFQRVEVGVDARFLRVAHDGVVIAFLENIQKEQSFRPAAFTSRARF